MSAHFTNKLKKNHFFINLTLLCNQRETMKRIKPNKKSNKK